MHKRKHTHTHSYTHTLIHIHIHKARCTVRVINKSSQMCVQADKDNLLFLRHIIKNIYERQGQIVRSPGHVTPSFLKKNSVFQDQKHFPKIDQKLSRKNSRGYAPHSLLTGLRPSHPPGLGAICLFAPLLDDPDSALSHKHTRAHVYTRTCTHTRTRIHAHTCARARTHTHTHTHTPRHKLTHTYSHTLTRVSICMYAFVHLRVFVYMRSRRNRHVTTSVV